jgi:tetratricopeptide (TPR) repeat protein
MRRAPFLAPLLAGALLVALAAAAAAQPAPAENRSPAIDAAFRRGNEAFYRGDFRGAVDAYEQVASLGVVHQDLYYNLGNAYYKAGRIGLAIFNYERALALDPDQADAKRNLEVARGAAERLGRDRVEGKVTAPFWSRAVTAIARPTLLWLFLGLYYACFLALFSLRFLAPGLGRAALGTGVALFGVAALIAGILFFGRLAHDRYVHEGVILPDEVTVKDGPSPGASTAFQLHAGLRVRLVERDHEWVRVRLPNGLEGWMREGDVGRL